MSKYRHYQPQAVTIKLFHKWLSQFPDKMRTHLVDLFCKIIFLTEAEVRKAMRSKHASLVERLAADGVDHKHTIYVQYDKAGSSSPVMLNMLRDMANLERKGAALTDSNTPDKILDLTFQLESGAIIYVDDFLGTGKQFIRTRNHIANYIVGTFSEFVIAPCMCEEAVQKIESEGIQAVTEIVHRKIDRPLHEENTTLDPAIKQDLLDLCKQINPRVGLGFNKVAAMIILYRNAPNNVPLLFRGSLHQSPYAGIFPRYDDLPL